MRRSEVACARPPHVVNRDAHTLGSSNSRDDLQSLVSNNAQSLPKPHSAQSRHPPCGMEVRGPVESLRASVEFREEWREHSGAESGRSHDAASSDRSLRDTKTEASSRSGGGVGNAVQPHKPAAALPMRRTRPPRLQLPAQLGGSVILNGGSGTSGGSGGCRSGGGSSGSGCSVSSSSSSGTASGCGNRVSPSLAPGSARVSPGSVPRRTPSPRSVVPCSPGSPYSAPPTLSRPQRSPASSSAFPHSPANPVASPGTASNPFGLASPQSTPSDTPRENLPAPRTRGSRPRTEIRSTARVQVKGPAAVAALRLDDVAEVYSSDEEFLEMFCDRDSDERSSAVAGVCLSATESTSPSQATGTASRSALPQRFSLPHSLSVPLPPPSPVSARRALRKASTCQDERNRGGSSGGRRNSRLAMLPQSAQLNADGFRCYAVEESPPNTPAAPVSATYRGACGHSDRWIDDDVDDRPPPTPRRQQEQQQQLRQERQQQQQQQTERQGEEQQAISAALSVSRAHPVAITSENRAHADSQRPGEARTPCNKAIGGRSRSSADLQRAHATALLPPSPASPSPGPTSPALPSPASSSSTAPSPSSPSPSSPACPLPPRRPRAVAVAVTLRAAASPTSPRFCPTSPRQQTPSSPRHCPLSPRHQTPSSPRHCPPSPRHHTPSSPRHALFPTDQQCPLSPRPRPPSPRPVPGSPRQHDVAPASPRRPTGIAAAIAAQAAADAAAAIPSDADSDEEATEILNALRRSRSNPRLKPSRPLAAPMAQVFAAPITAAPAARKMAAQVSGAAGCGGESVAARASASGFSFGSRYSHDRSSYSEQDYSDRSYGEDSYIQLRSDENSSGSVSRRRSLDNPRIIGVTGSQGPVGKAEITFSNTPAPLRRQGSLSSGMNRVGFSGGEMGGIGGVGGKMTRGVGSIGRLEMLPAEPTRPSSNHGLVGTNNPASKGALQVVWGKSAVDEGPRKGEQVGSGEGSTFGKGPRRPAGGRGGRVMEGGNTSEGWECERRRRYGGGRGTLLHMRSRPNVALEKEDGIGRKSGTALMVNSPPGHPQQGRGGEGRRGEKGGLQRSTMGGRSITVSGAERSVVRLAERGSLDGASAGAGAVGSRSCSWIRGSSRGISLDLDLDLAATDTDPYAGADAGAGAAAVGPSVALAAGGSLAGCSSVSGSAGGRGSGTGGSSSRSMGISKSSSSSSFGIGSSSNRISIGSSDSSGSMSTAGWCRSTGSSTRGVVAYAPVGSAAAAAAAAAVDAETDTEAQYTRRVPATTGRKTVRKTGVSADLDLGYVVRGEGEGFPCREKETEEEGMGDWTGKEEVVRLTGPTEGETQELTGFQKFRDWHQSQQRDLRNGHHLENERSPWGIEDWTGREEVLGLREGVSEGLTGFQKYRNQNQSQQRDLKDGYYRDLEIEEGQELSNPFRSRSMTARSATRSRVSLPDKDFDFQAGARSSSSRSRDFTQEEWPGHLMGEAGDLEGDCNDVDGRADTLWDKLWDDGKTEEWGKIRKSWTSPCGPTVLGFE